MKVAIIEFHQETNSFNPIPTSIDYFENSRIYEGEDIRIYLENKPCAIGGMLKAIDETDVETILGYTMFTMSGGPVDQKVVDHFIEKVSHVIQNNLPIDGVFISLHGATQTTEYDDCSGYIIEKVREMIGNESIIAASTDLHANITSKMMTHTDIICGYQTYPHLDHFETGYRTAKIGLACLLENVKPTMVQVKIPMIVPASAYNTMSGPFAELIDCARSLDLVDFSIYQMQPWLDVKEGASSILVIDYDREKAENDALKLANKLFQLRKEFVPHQLSIEEVIDIAEQKDKDKPVILVDSADSTNAGATGDSVAVVQKLLERQSKIRVAFVVNDKPAADLAHQTGVGKTISLTIGGSKYPEMNRPIQIKAYIKSLHDGIYIQEGPAGRGLKNNIGASAVLQVGSIDILVCQHIFGNGDPQLYRAFGIEPTFYDLVVVKACNSFRAAYSLLSDQIYETDTPGAASVNLKSLPFKKLPKHFYPFSELDNFDIKDLTIART